MREVERRGKVGKASKGRQVLRLRPEASKSQRSAGNHCVQPELNRLTPAFYCPIPYKTLNHPSSASLPPSPPVSPIEPATTHISRCSSNCPEPLYVSLSSLSFRCRDDVVVLSLLASASVRTRGPSVGNQGKKLTTFAQTARRFGCLSAGEAQRRPDEGIHRSHRLPQRFVNISPVFDFNCPPPKRRSEVAFDAKRWPFRVAGAAKGRPSSEAGECAFLSDNDIGHANHLNTLAVHHIRIDHPTPINALPCLRSARRSSFFPPPMPSPSSSPQKLLLRTHFTNLQSPIQPTSSRSSTSRSSRPTSPPPLRSPTPRARSRPSPSPPPPSLPRRPTSPPA